MVVYSVLLIFFTAFLTAGSYSYLTRAQAIKELIKGVREVARLNLDYKVPVKSKDEFGKLAYASMR